MDIVDDRRLPVDHADLALLAVAVFGRDDHAPSLLHILTQRRTPVRVGQFGLALFKRTDSGLIPGRQLVEQAHGLQGEIALNRHTDIDRQDNRLTVGLLAPGQLLAPAVGVVGVGHDGVPVHRPTAGLGQFQQEVQPQALEGRAHGPLDRTAVELAHDLGHFQEFFPGRDLGRQIAAVIVPVGHAERTRKTEAAGLQGFAQHVLDARDLVRGRRVIGIAGRLIAHDPGAQRRVGHQRGGIHPDLVAFQAVQKLGKGLPVPAHRGLHDGQRDGLGALHTQHRPLLVLGPDRGKAKAAVADGHTRHPMPAGQRGVRVPAGQGRVVVGVDVHEAGRHHAAGGVDNTRRVAGDIPHRRDLAVADGQISTVRGRA